jgi:chromosome partitioning protein
MIPTNHPSPGPAPARAASQSSANTQYPISNIQYPISNTQHPPPTTGSVPDSRTCSGPIASVTIAISSEKGGVAKTTTCLSLGAALAEMGLPVLLIDLDPQANLTMSLGLKPDQLRRTVVDALMGTSSLLGVSQETGTSGLDLVPANHELALADKVFYKMPGYQFRLRQALARLVQGMYRCVLLDCPPALAPLTLNALAAADLLIVPVQCEVYAARSLQKMARFAQQLREQVNPGLDVRGLITMYDQRNKISRIILEQLHNGQGLPFFETIIQIDARLKESPVYGQPVTSHASRSRGAQQYRALAAELTSGLFSAMPSGAQDDASAVDSAPLDSRHERE